MTQSELDNLNIVRNELTFKPRYTYDNFDADTEVYTGLVITATAEEVYQEYLNQNNQPQQPTQIEILQQQVQALQDTVIMITMM